MSCHDYGRRSGADGLLHSNMCCKLTKLITAAHLPCRPELAQGYQLAWLQCLLTMLCLSEQGCTVPEAICRRDQRSLCQVQLHSASASEHHGEPAELPDHADPACTGLPLARVCAGSGLGCR